MKRRDILKYTALMTGAALGTPLILSLNSCKTDSTSMAEQGKLLFFDEEQMALVRSIVDTILPKTDSPSASEVGVHHTIDRMVGLVYNADDKKNYTKTFAQLSAFIKKEAKNNAFQKLSEAERLAILRSLSKSEDDNLAAAKEGYLSIKQQTIAFYLNTKEIATNYLNYLPIPGQYEGCISLESVGGKAWAL